MRRILSLGGIPNVVSFTLPDKKFIRELYKLGVIAFKKRKIQNVHSLVPNSKANKYIIKQTNRLLKYAKAGQWEKFNFLSKKLLCSYAFQIYAMQAVFPKFITLKVSTIKFLFRHLRTIAFREQTNIKLTRVWIDKKKGDYGRPLGVPSVVWRVYLRMILNLSEIAVEGQGIYQQLQHGGRPGYGVGTCLVQMIQMVREAHTVLEFDIKGFFNNISKKAMLDILPEGHIKKQMTSLICAKPDKYKYLPSQNMWDPKNAYMDFNEMRLAFRELVDPFIERTGLSFAQATLYLAKDIIFGLMKPDKGVPQGTAFGTFLSSTTVGYHLKDIPNLLMYCDDGMIFLKEGDPDPLPGLQDALKKIGLEIHPEKTKLRDLEYLRRFGLKFLGTRLFIDKGELRMVAESRAGSRKLFTECLPHAENALDYEVAHARLYEKLEVLINLLLVRAKQINLSEKYVSKQLISLAIKYNFFNYLLSRAYNPGTTERDMKNAIIEGLQKAFQKMTANPLSLSAQLLNNKLYSYVIDNKIRYVRPDIFNLSTFACCLLLKQRKEFIFDKSNRCDVKPRCNLRRR